MSSQTTICAKRVCANAGRMNDLKLENSGVGTNALLQLQNTNGDANGPIIKLMKNPSDGGSDINDTCGVIQFHSLDSGAASTQFAEISASISSVTATDEAGKLELKVAESDGENTAVTTGLSLTGSSSVDGQVDVTIGAGATSIVSVPGIVKSAYSAIYVGTRAATAHLVLTGAIDSTNTAIAGNAGTFPAGSLVLLNNADNNANTITVSLPDAGASTKGIWYHFLIVAAAAHNDADIIIDGFGTDDKMVGPIMAGVTAVSKNCNNGTITFDASGNGNNGKATMNGAFIKILGTGESGANAWVVEILSPLTADAAEIALSN